MTSQHENPNSPPPPPPISTELTHNNSDSTYSTELNNDCLFEILTRLSIDERFKGPLSVSREWFNACKDPLLNDSLDLEPYFESLTESTFWWSHEFGRRIDSFMRFVSESSNEKLTEIRVRHCSDRGLEFAAQRCPNLQVLEIKNSERVSDAAMIAVANMCPLLEELDISFCHQISHESLSLIGRRCHLKVLRRNSVKLSDLDAKAIGDHMPNLKQLEIKFSDPSGQGLALIDSGCAELEPVDLEIARE